MWLPSSRHPFQVQYARCHKTQKIISSESKSASQFKKLHWNQKNNLNWWFRPIPLNWTTLQHCPENLTIQNRFLQSANPLTSVRRSCRDIVLYSSSFTTTKYFNLKKKNIWKLVRLTFSTSNYKPTSHSSTSVFHLPAGYISWQSLEYVNSGTSSYKTITTHIGIEY